MSLKCAFNSPSQILGKVMFCIQLCGLDKHVCFGFLNWLSIIPLPAISLFHRMFKDIIWDKDELFRSGLGDRMETIFNSETTANMQVTQVLLSRYNCHYQTHCRYQNTIWTLNGIVTINWTTTRLKSTVLNFKVRLTSAQHRIFLSLSDQRVLDTKIWSLIQLRLKPEQSVWHLRF